MKITRILVPFVILALAMLACGCGRRPARFNPRTGLSNQPSPDSGAGADGLVDGLLVDGTADRTVDGLVDRAVDGSVDVPAGGSADAQVGGRDGGVDVSDADGQAGDGPAALCTPTSNPAGPPMISAFSEGCAGGVLFIRGTNLGGEGTCVVAGGISLLPSLSDLGDLAVNLPANFLGGATSVQVTTLQGGTERTAEILDLPPPAPASIAPNPAAPGATVTIMGTDLTWVTAVLVLGVGNSNQARPAIDSQTATTLRFVVPALPDGSYSVRLTNPCGTGSVMSFAIMR